MFRICLTSNINILLAHLNKTHTYLLSLLCNETVVNTVTCAGRGGVEVQVRPVALVKLQPPVVSDKGRVRAGGGGYSWAPIPTQRDRTNPDTRPDIAP